MTKIDKPKILAVSFDLWGTLIKSNPEYRKERTKYIQLHTDMPAPIIDVTIANIKRDIDTGVEKFGFHYESLDVYSMIHKQCKIKNITPEDLYHDCAALFIKTMPVLIPGVDEVIKKLHADGYKIYLSSNTVLIDGKYLTVVLDKLGILQYFTKTIFSNEIRVSKPNPAFFKAVHMHSGMLTEQIIHVGDNAITDAQGSTDYGFRKYLLSGGLTVNDFYKHFVEFNGISWNASDNSQLLDVAHKQE
jgi:putative hydrolase of the HAD superfamily